MAGGVEGCTVGVLGPVVLLRDGEPLGHSLGGPKQRLVLSLLVCGQERVVSVRRLVDGIWGDEATDAARATLRAYVSRLRHAIDGAGTIQQHHGGYTLRVANPTDADCLEQLADEASTCRASDPLAALAMLDRALAAWRGVPFGDLAPSRALASEVSRLEHVRLRALTMRAAIQIDRGDPDTAVPELRELARAHPLHEPLQRLLLLGLYRAGQQAGALVEYERIRSHLAAELGADPSRQLRDLHAAILRQDPALDVDRRSTVPPSTPVVQRRPGELPLVGRDRELADIDHHLEWARRGRTQVLFLAGEAGVGKTRLVQAAAAGAAERGDLVLHGQCAELGAGAVPFGPIRQGLRQLVDRLAEDGDAWIGRDRRLLAGVLPELADASDDRSGEHRSGVVAGVVRALERASAGRPLVLVLEDLHWADRSTLDLLLVLSGRVDAGRLSVLATYRTDELHRRHPLRQAVGDLVRQEGVARIDLPPLDREGVATLVEHLMGAVSADVVDEVHGRSSGNPFYVVELVQARSSREELTSGLRDAIAARVDPLPEVTRRLVEVAAVVGSRTDELLLSLVMDMDVLTVARRIRPAVERHVLVVRDMGYEFRHDLVREFVLDDLLPGERLELHRRVATVLEEHPRLAAGGVDAADHELASHWEAARDDHRAFAALLRAAQRARSSGAYTDALELEERALRAGAGAGVEAHVRLALLEQAAESAGRAAAWRRAVSLVRTAIDEVDGDRPREARLRSVLAKALASSGIDREAAILEADRAVALVGGLGDDVRRARVLHAAAQVRLVLWDFGEASQELAAAALDTAASAGDDETELHARITLASIRAAAGRARHEDAIDELQAARRQALARGDVSAGARALNNMVVALDVRASADPERPERILTDALRWLDDEVHHEHQAVQNTRIRIAWKALQFGAIGLTCRALSSLDSTSLELDDRAEFLQVRSRLHFVSGRLDDALADTRRLLAIRLDIARHQRWAGELAARVHAARGQVDDVRRIVEQHAAPDATEQDAVVATFQLLGILVRAEADAAALTSDVRLAADHRRRATRALDQMVELHGDAARPGGAHLLPTTRRDLEAALAVARAATYERRDASSVDAWARAVDAVWTAFDRCEVRLRYAAALLEVDDPAGPVQLLQARREATDLGAALLLEEAEALIGAHDADEPDHRRLRPAEG